MKILYNNTKIYERIKASQWTDWAYYNIRINGEGKHWMLKPDGTDNIHLPLDLLDLNEVEVNRTLCRDIWYVRNKTDKSGDPKYSVKDGNIEEKPDWKEHVEEYF